MSRPRSGTANQTWSIKFYVVKEKKKKNKLRRRKQVADLIIKTERICEEEDRLNNL